MVICSKCGRVVGSPVKTWPIPSQKPLEEGNEPKLIGIFECLNCKARFASVVEVEAKIEEIISVKNMVGRIKVIKGGLMQTLIVLRKKIKTLETERVNLMIEIENLRQVAESKVNALEGEVIMLREEVRSLRSILGYVKEEEMAKK